MTTPAKMWILFLPIVVSAHYIPDTLKGDVSKQEPKQPNFKIMDLLRRKHMGSSTKTASTSDLRKHFSLKEIKDRLLIYRSSYDYEEGYGVADLIRDLAVGNLKAFVMPSEKDLYTDYAYGDASHHEGDSDLEVLMFRDQDGDNTSVTVSSDDDDGADAAADDDSTDTSSADSAPGQTTVDGTKDNDTVNDGISDSMIELHSREFTISTLPPPLSDAAENETERTTHSVGYVKEKDLLETVGNDTDQTIHSAKEVGIVENFGDSGDEGPQSISPDVSDAGINVEEVLEGIKKEMVDTEGLDTILYRSVNNETTIMNDSSIDQGEQKLSIKKNNESMSSDTVISKLQKSPSDLSKGLAKIGKKLVGNLPKAELKLAAKDGKLSEQLEVSAKNTTLSQNASIGMRSEAESDEELNAEEENKDEDNPEDSKEKSDETEEKSEDSEEKSEEAEEKSEELEVKSEEEEEKSEEEEEKSEEEEEEKSEEEEEKSEEEEEKSEEEKSEEEKSEEEEEQSEEPDNKSEGENKSEDESKDESDESDEKPNNSDEETEESSENTENKSEGSNDQSEDSGDKSEEKPENESEESDDEPNEQEDTENGNEKDEDKATATKRDLQEVGSIEKTHEVKNNHNSSQKFNVTPEVNIEVEVESADDSRGIGNIMEFRTTYKNETNIDQSSGPSQIIAKNGSITALVQPSPNGGGDSVVETKKVETHTDKHSETQRIESHVSKPSEPKKLTNNTESIPLKIFKGLEDTATGIIKGAKDIFLGGEKKIDKASPAMRRRNADGKQEMKPFETAVKIFEGAEDILLSGAEKMEEVVEDSMVLRRSMDGQEPEIASEEDPEVKLDKELDHLEEKSAIPGSSGKEEQVKDIGLVTTVLLTTTAAPSSPNDTHTSNLKSTTNNKKDFLKAGEGAFEVAAESAEKLEEVLEDVLEFKVANQSRQQPFSLNSSSSQKSRLGQHDNNDDADEEAKLIFDGLEASADKERMYAKLNKRSLEFRRPAETVSESETTQVKKKPSQIPFDGMMGINPKKLEKLISQFGDAIASSTQQVFSGFGKDVGRAQKIAKTLEEIEIDEVEKMQLRSKDIPVTEPPPVLTKNTTLEDSSPIAEEEDAESKMIMDDIEAALDIDKSLEKTLKDMSITKRSANNKLKFEILSGGKVARSRSERAMSKTPDTDEDDIEKDFTNNSEETEKNQQAITKIPLVMESNKSRTDSLDDDYDSIIYNYDNYDADNLEDYYIPSDYYRSYVYPVDNYVEDDEDDDFDYNYDYYPDQEPVYVDEDYYDDSGSQDYGDYSLGKDRKVKLSESNDDKVNLKVTPMEPNVKEVKNNTTDESDFLDDLPSERSTIIHNPSRRNSYPFTYIISPYFQHMKSLG